VYLKQFNRMQGLLHDFDECRPIFSSMEIGVNGMDSTLVHRSA